MNQKFSQGSRWKKSAEEQSDSENSAPRRKSRKRQWSFPGSIGLVHRSKSSVVRIRSALGERDTFCSARFTFSYLNINFFYFSHVRQKRPRRSWENKCLSELRRRQHHFTSNRVMSSICASASSCGLAVRSKMFLSSGLRTENGITNAEVGLLGANDDREFSSVNRRNFGYHHALYIRK